MFKPNLFHIWLFLIFLTFINSSPLPPTGIQPHYQNNNNNNTQHIVYANDSIDALIQKQTETVKAIVSNHHQHVNQHSNKPNNNNKPLPVSRPTPEPEKFTLDELKIKCQHLANLAAKNKTNKIDNQINHNGHRNHSGFYITTKPTPIATRKPTIPPLATTRKPVQNVKFIKLEPVILQKTVLNDGRTIYYWLKSLPSAFQYNPNLSSTPSTTTTTTTTQPTTTTTIRTGGLNFRNFFPFYPYGYSETSTSTSTTTTEKTTTTPTTNTVEAIENDQNNEHLVYQQQLKFVVPVPYTNDDIEDSNSSGTIKKPWELDQFAYYPKPLQPETINVQVPYVPTFHVIKAVAVPNQYEIPQKQQGEDDENSSEELKALDNVNV